MKNIFTTITYVANQIKEAITGHKNDKQAHPDLNEQIKVLSEKAYWKPVNWKNVNDTPESYGFSSTTIFFCDEEKNGNHGDLSFPNVCFGSKYAIVITTNYNGNFSLQYAISSHNQSKYIKYRLATPINQWGNWQTIATTDKTEISFPYNSGITDVGSGEKSIISKSNNLVNIILNAYRGTPFNKANEVIGTIPAGYRPFHRLSFVVRGTTNDFISVEILPNGAVYVKTNGVNTTRLQGTLTYYTE